MRDKASIKKTLKSLEKIWEKNPDLRFMQLIGNALPRQDNYYMEDDRFEEIVRSFYVR